MNDLITRATLKLASGFTWGDSHSNIGVMSLITWGVDGRTISLDKFDTDTPITTKSHISELVSIFLNRKITKVVLCVRTELEPGVENPIPSIDMLDKLMGKLTKNGIESVVFKQESWPEPLPNFVMTNNTFVLRFGYSEGHPIDDLAVSNKLKHTIQTNKSNMKGRKVITLLTPMENYIL